MGLKSVLDRTILKYLIENISKTFLKDADENQLLLNVCKTFSEQTFTKHCQKMLFKRFMCFVYQLFHDECLKNIASITFISSAIF